MKDHIQKHNPEVHRSYKKLRAAVQEAWDSITTATIRQLIDGMEEKCLDVIVANGTYTKL